MFNRRQVKLVESCRAYFVLEGLETRRFLSAAPTLVHHAADTSGSAITQHSSAGSSGGSSSTANTVILFSAAPSAVQTGLQTLAGSTTIPSNQRVHENTLPDGTEIYCIKLKVDGKSTVYAVDSTGASVPVPQPPKQGGGAGNTGGSSSSGSSGTGSTGTGSSGTGSTGTGSSGTGSTGTVSNGVTVVSFSAAPSAVQSGLQTLAGSTTIPSDQPVHESTAPDGTEIYAIKLTVSGTSTVYAVDSSGDAVPVPPPPPTAPSGSSTGSPTGGSETGGSSSGSQQGSTGGSGTSAGSPGNGDGQQTLPPPPPQGTQSGTGASPSSDT